MMRQEHRADENLFVDYAGMTVEVIDAQTGAITYHPIFVAALGALSSTYAKPVRGRTPAPGSRHARLAGPASESLCVHGIWGLPLTVWKFQPVRLVKIGLLVGPSP
jgi:transposase